eukprot:TRINITY_DN17283_c0_g1_i3.p1 TRINITY_DN17283_c0_g1~~TRINITY_DN17283_c0_g1_i3.p1  ORF type:complete len:219 (-),score=27.47 TRINITY_DN17283_c0_g1_i3:100-690(-)
MEQEHCLPTCRFCLETSVNLGDEFIVPCLCSGSMKYVHRSCLDTWRVNGFNPKTLTHCGTCHFCFKTETQSNSSCLGAAGDLFLEVFIYVAIRLGGFVIAVAMLGFVPYLFFDPSEIIVFDNVIVNHLTLGSAGTFALSGGFVILKVIASANFLNLGHWTRGHHDKDSWKFYLVVLVVIGFGYLLYKLAVGGAWGF